MKKVYVEGNDGLIERMFTGLGWKPVDASYKADILVFSGGADVSPELYGERNVASGNNRKRDDWCGALFGDAKFIDQPMIGICRGAQFLHVANGGKMWQDVNLHAIGGTHEATDDDGSVHLVTSTHHQMMRLHGPSEAIVVATANRADYKRSADGYHHHTDDDAEQHWPDMEVLWYPKTRSLCYQPHPEYGVKTCLDHFVKQLERFDLR